MFSLWWWVLLSGCWALQASPPSLLGLQRQALRPMPSTGQVTPLEPAPAVDSSTWPTESPCWVIDRFELPTHRWLLQGLPRGRCWGASGLSELQRRLQERLYGWGEVTSQVVLPEQDVSRGVLRLAVKSGRVGSIRWVCQDERGQPTAGWGGWGHALSLSVGDVVNLRRLEQGMLNLRRSSDAEVVLAPGSEPGLSEVVIIRRQGSWHRHVHGGIQWDNTGDVKLGRSQGTGWLTVDHVLGLSERWLLYVSGSLGQVRRSRTQLWQVTIPWRYHEWQLGSQGSRTVYQLPTRGGRWLEHRSQGHQQQVQWSYVLGRDSHRALTVRTRWRRVVSRSWVDGVLLGIHGARSLWWSWVIDYRHRWGLGEGTVTVQHERVVGGVRPKGYGQRPQRLMARLQWQQGMYQSVLQFQHSSQRLMFSEQLALGGRWQVRGFDGDRVLSSECGWLWQQTWRWGRRGVAPYLGLDVGRVWGVSSQDLPGRCLAGLALGLGWVWSGWRSNVGMGFPLHQPKGFNAGRAWVPYWQVGYVV